MRNESTNFAARLDVGYEEKEIFEMKQWKNEMVTIKKKKVEEETETSSSVLETLRLDAK